MLMYQQRDGEQLPRIYYLQFDAFGKFIRQFTHAFAEEYTGQYARPSGNVLTDFRLNINADNTLSVVVLEEVEGDGKYPRVLKINYETGSISDFVQFGGKVDKSEYYLDQNFGTLGNGNDEVYFIGRTSKGDMIWLNRVSLK